MITLQVLSSLALIKYMKFLTKDQTKFIVVHFAKRNTKNCGVGKARAGWEFLFPESISFPPRLSGRIFCHAKRGELVSPYKAGLCAAEMTGQKSESLVLERVSGVEPPFHPWQGCVITAIRHPQIDLS